MRKYVSHFPLSCIMNTDEVAVLYRALPSPSISEDVTAYELIKDRLTAVFTVFADGSKAPWTIIGTSRRLRSFPRHFGGLRDLNLYYMAQQNAWNTKNIWTQIVSGFDKFARLEGKSFINFVDNCSAHNNSYKEFTNFNCSVLPPNLTSHLQSVDADVRRSFKYNFRRLLV